MATIAENLLALQETKENFKTSFESKGVDLTDVPFTEYPNKLEDLKENLDTELTEQETLLNELEENVNALSDKDDTALKIMQGTLEEFDNKEWGMTTIPRDKFYEFHNLGKVRLHDDVTEVNEYAFYYAGDEVENPDFEVNLHNCFVYQYAFYQSAITKLTCHSPTNLGSYSFHELNHCTDMDIVLDSNLGSMGQYVFMKLVNLEKLKSKFSFDAKTLQAYNFYSIGNNRTNPENNIFELDFSECRFGTIAMYCLRGGAVLSGYNKYIKIMLPNTVKTINNGCFSFIDHNWIYFRSTTVPTITTSVFNDVIDSKVFVPYNLINAYKTATNWTLHADMIFGWAEENTFEQGQVLPKYNAEGYELTWYSDEELTIPVTSVTDPSKIYYCASTSTEPVEVVEVERLIKTNCDVTILDNATGYQYDKKGYIPVGVELTITVTPTIDGYVPYLVTFNDVEFTSPHTYTIVTGTNIDLVCIYYNGVDTPAVPNFAENSWSLIKKTVQNGDASKYWSVGDVKEIEIDGLTYGIRLSDLQMGRYEYSDGTRTTNAVFEFVELLSPTRYKMNTTGTNDGGWATCQMNTTFNTTILERMPNELRDLLEEVVIASADSGISGYTITTTNNKLFLPCAMEVGLTTSYGAKEEGTTWDYYINITNSMRIKYLNGIADPWWTRSPYPSQSYPFSYVTSGGAGAGVNSPSNNLRAISPCFAW